MEASLYNIPKGTTAILVINGRKQTLVNKHKQLGLMIPIDHAITEDDKKYTITDNKEHTKQPLQLQVARIERIGPNIRIRNHHGDGNSN